MIHMRIHRKILYLKEEKNTHTHTKKAQSSRTSTTNMQIVNEKMNTRI